MLIEPEPLAEFVAGIFAALGTAADAAAETAGHLVQANLKGHDSHGVGMVPTYVRNIRAGHLNVDARAELVLDRGAVMLVDGHAGFGQVVGRQATDRALERVRETSLVCMGVRNCHHLGRIGAYGEQCGRAGMVSVHFVNVVGHEPQVSPWGGRERRLTTNPFCCVVPRAGGEPIVLDMATSALALGKVRVAHMKGDRVPEGVLVDHEGHPTTDPAVMYEPPFGALGPFGKHKGYGMAVMCELLGGALAGAWTAQPQHPRPGTVINHMLMFVLDPAAFGGLETFESEVAALTGYLHATRPADGFDRVRVPGDPEQETLAARTAGGIPIDDNSWRDIVEAARVAGLGDDRIPQPAG